MGLGAAVKCVFSVTQFPQGSILVLSLPPLSQEVWGIRSSSARSTEPFQRRRLELGALWG